MDTAATLILVLLLVVVAPIWIVAHYATRWRSARMLSRDQERVLAELWETSRRMEERMAGLERILDTEAPGWRARTNAGPWTEAGTEAGQ